MWYLQRPDTAQWSRKVPPLTWWTTGPETPRRKLRRRPLREPWGPEPPAASLSKETIHTFQIQPQSFNYVNISFLVNSKRFWCIFYEVSALIYLFLWWWSTTRSLWSCQTCSCTIGRSFPCRPTPTRTTNRHSHMIQTLWYVTSAWKKRLLPSPWLRWTA